MNGIIVGNIYNLLFYLLYFYFQVVIYYYFYYCQANDIHIRSLDRYKGVYDCYRTFRTYIFLDCE